MGHVCTKLVDSKSCWSDFEQLFDLLAVSRFRVDPTIHSFRWLLVHGDELTLSYVLNPYTHSFIEPVVTRLLALQWRYTMIVIPPGAQLVHRLHLGNTRSVEPFIGRHERCRTQTSKTLIRNRMLDHTWDGVSRIERWVQLYDASQCWALYTSRASKALRDYNALRAFRTCAQTLTWTYSLETSVETAGIPL